jgi:hypothetical protein
MTNNSIGATPQCKICGMSSELFDETQILHKYPVRYFRCMACSFVQTETPYWLGEAYASAISRLDTGILFRNILNQRITGAVINFLFPEAKRSLDYGAGHGIFVRLMRDNGFEFYWHDPHATNDYASGFDHKEGEMYDLLTSFEVMEHLTDPVTELSKMMSLSPNVFISTEILPNPAPKVSEWWYYAPMSGQHISFYTLESLQLIASRFKRNLLSRGPFHLFTAEPKSRLLFRIATSMSGSKLLNAFRKRPSLKDSDFRLMSSR